MISTLGGFILSLFIIEIGEKPDLEVMEAGFGALIIALPQSYLLRTKVLPFSWIISTILGWVLITIMSLGTLGWFVLSTQFLSFRIFYGIISGGIGGLVIGMTQWWLAIPPSLCWGWCWMFFNSAIWAIAFSLGSVVGKISYNLTHMFWGEIVGLGFTWLVVSILTGMSAYILFK
ncbi:MAG: hypothetical protein F6K62_18905 [Sphaerospermopsis sp. SIO1G2]|nr:hypothetical protein [Sphaerospermopsis sp. SIO1G1]NET72920.1 hypothetical protein [Sphaerospermopsis sp. SIO1G2]